MIKYIFSIANYLNQEIKEYKMSEFNKVLNYGLWLLWECHYDQCEEEDFFDYNEDGFKKMIGASRQFVIKILDGLAILISRLMPNHHMLIANIIPAVRQRHLMRLWHRYTVPTPTRIYDVSAKMMCSVIKRKPFKTYVFSSIKRSLLR